MKKKPIDILLESMGYPYVDTSRNCVPAVLEDTTCLPCINMMQDRTIVLSAQEKLVSPCVHDFFNKALLL